jgi:hypothetical protein
VRTTRRMAPLCLERKEGRKEGRKIKEQRKMKERM